jgi:hypothetical protein
MQRRWKNKIREFWKMIPPLRGGDFQGIAGLSSDDSLLGGVSTAREQSFNKTPALSSIGPMSPARLSLSTVASPHCRLLFHLAGGILTANNDGCQGQLRTKRLSSLKGGWKLSYCSPLPVEGEIFFLTFPFIDQAWVLKNSPSSPNSRNLRDTKCLGIRERRLNRILMQSLFRQSRQKEFFNSHARFQQFAI